MLIKNISLKSIEARRYTKPNSRPKQIRIDHNSTITIFSATSKTQATVEFQYTASYGSTGIIRLEGSLLYDGEKADKLADEWGKTHKLPDELAGRIHTAVMHACVPEAVTIAKDLMLPPPIPLPQVKLGQKYKPGSQEGPEIT